MDLDDLFGAFDGEEKINDVHEATDELSAGAGKRKVVTDERHGEGPANKRQASKGSEGTKSGGVGGNLDSSSAATTVVDGRVALKEGEESSTLREDGTLVKSVRTTSTSKQFGVFRPRAAYSMQINTLFSVCGRAQLLQCCVLLYQVLRYIMSRSIVRAIRLIRARASHVGYSSVEGNGHCHGYECM